VLGGLDVLDGRVLVDVALVVDVELSEGILERKDVALLELRVFPRAKSASRASRWRQLTAGA
jgi:hypothetical protein